ncbi:hypothetical protein CR513_16319, partial [Mucuna pruriens]
MCLTLQKTELYHPESVGEIGGYQYGQQPYQSRAESRAICGSAIWIRIECTSNSKWLSVAESTIPGATVRKPTTIENATSKQLTIFGGSDEAIRYDQPGVPTKYELQ